MKLRAEASGKIGSARARLERECEMLEERLGKLEQGGLVDDLPPWIEDTGSLE